MNLVASITGPRYPRHVISRQYPIRHYFSTSRANPVFAEGTIVHAGLKAFSYVVLVLMAVGIIYASYIGIKYWTGISV